MHSATRLDDLKILESFLQNSLHAHLGRIIPFGVQCLYKNDTLWVLAQHPADVLIDIADAFGVLERSLQAEEPKTPLPVKLYLRAEGSERPYSQQSFTVYPLVKKVVPGEAAPEMTGMTEDQMALENINPDQHPPEQHLTVEQQISALNLDHGRFDETPEQSVKMKANDFGTDIDHSFIASSSFTEETTYPQARLKRKSKIIPILGGLGVLATGLGAAYMGTRPCVLQSVCTELNTATKVTQSSFALLNNPRTTGKDVLTAQKQIHQSVEDLKSIPVWSGSYDNAQQSLQATEPQVTHLDRTVGAMEKAYRAAKISNTPQIPLEKWEQSRQMWIESIATLSKIPSTSKVYPLAQQKLTDYQGKLADIQRRIGIESSTGEKLKSATEGAKSASKSQAAAQSLSEWREVKKQWDQVSDEIGSIPPTSVAYSSAQTLLKSSQPQITIAKEKVQQEDKATQNYNNAIKLARSAQLAQKNNQLAQAVAQWNQAVVAIQSVPKDSVVYTQAKPLMLDYAKSFQQAEEQLKNTDTIAFATKNLQQSCTGTREICSYTVTNKGIIVRLTPLYAQTLNETAQAAVSKSDGQAKMGLINHLKTLGDALQTISDNTKLPLEVYRADGQLIQNYRPQ